LNEIVSKWVDTLTAKTDGQKESNECDEEEEEEEKDEKEAEEEKEEERLRAINKSALRRRPATSITSIQHQSTSFNPFKINSINFKPLKRRNVSKNLVSTPIFDC